MSWRLITLQYCSGFCHTLTWISHGFTCVPHPAPPSCLPPHPIPLGLPSAPAPSSCLMHPAWAGDVSPLIVYLFQCYSPLGFLKYTSSGLMGFVWLMGPEPWGTRLNQYCPRISSCNLRSCSVSLITCCVSPTKYIWLACQCDVSDWESSFLNPLQDSFQKTVLSL